MRLAIVHDYLTQTGGAERVVEAMHAVWPQAPIYTSVYDPKATFPSFGSMDVRTSFLQRFAGKARYHEYLTLLYPIAFENFDMSSYDVVLSSSSTFAKGVITGPDTCHICYCHTPTRLVWRYHEYISQGGHGGLKRRLLPFVVPRLRAWDYMAAQRVDYFIANSANIARRIQKYYGRTSEVLYPPVQTDRFSIALQPRADYFLIVSRFIGYKKVDLAVEACSRLGLPLKVVGTGPQAAALRAMAGPTVEFLGRLSDIEVADLLANCRAFLFPGEEDLGIAPLEAMASGRPVVAYGAGGALETVVKNQTGVFFDRPQADSLMETLQLLSGESFDPPTIRAHAETFSLQVFQQRLYEMVERYHSQHCSRYARQIFLPHPEPTTPVVASAHLPHTSMLPPVQTEFPSLNPSHPARAGLASPAPAGL